MSIIQWNINSFHQNRPELEHLLQNNPAIICLQETKAKEPLKMRGFTSYNVFSRAADDRACGGVSVLIKNCISQTRVPVTSNIQCVAVRVSLHRTFTVCSIYIPPSQSFAIADLDHIYSQLPSPAMLVGDFNAHHVSWGNNRTSTKGIIIDNFLRKNSLNLMNDGSFTYLHPGSGTQTAIDLSICHPSLFLDFKWRVSDDSSGSDHFPIFIDTLLPSPDESPPHLILSKANWDLFSHYCETEITTDIFENESYPISIFTAKINEIANKCIPSSSGKCKKRKRPWFNQECKDAINSRKKSLSNFQKQPTQDNLIHFKHFKAKARRTIRTCKKQSWQKYVSTLNNQTPMTKVWEMVKKISGKCTKNSLSMLKKDQTTISNTEDIANCFAHSFSNNSSNENYSEKFKRHQAISEKNTLNFKSNFSHQYNKKLKMKELLSSIKKAKNTSPGPDQIHYQLLKHLPFSCLQILLNILNFIWDGGDFPPEWSDAIVIAIPKPGKDPTSDTNYRPISLTSCLCKTMERIINDRLMYYLESNKLLTALQSGFRKSRSTTDHLIRLETFIRQSFIKGEHCVGVFFDMEKAYDMTWKYGIMKDLYDFDLRGNLPIFIDKFLHDRAFQVRVGSTLSQEVIQEQGVPQGSILSVTLFAIKINSIVKCLTNDTNASLYVDDFQICFSGQNMSVIERKLQLCINKLEKWSNENGFRFSATKTACVHFCRKRKLHLDPELFLSGNKIPVVDQVKFLGLIFDNKLNFKPHILQLKEKCKKALNLLKVVSHFDWGGDRKVMLQLYKSLILSKLDYGCFIYGSSPKSYIKMLDPIQNECLRLCLGAYKTSPVESLEVEANVPPLRLRREQLALQYVLKLRSNPSNPAYPSFFEPQLQERFASKPKTIPTLNIRLQEALDQLNLNFDSVAFFELPKTPPWTFEPLCVHWDLTEYLKNQTSPIIYQAEFKRVVHSKFKGYHLIYTDGSKQEFRAASAACDKNNFKIERLLDHASIFSAELNAIHLALDLIETDYESTGNFVICSDSKSSLQALEGDDFTNPFLLSIRERIDNLSTNSDLNLNFLWIPSHIGIRGNEEVDILAKNGLMLHHTNNVKLPYSDLRSQIKPHIRKRWQIAWNEETRNKLKEIQPDIGMWKHSSRKSRREEIILARLRIGHTHFTHSFIRRGEPPPECISCDCDYTVKHILFDCAEYSHFRNSYLNENDIKSLFEKTSPDNIINFIKETGLYYKL